MADDKFCALPFSALVLSPDGEVYPCCYIYGSTYGYSYGNATTDGGLMSVWNGEKIRSLRREFITGEIKTCEKYIRHIGCNKHHIHLKDHIEVKEVQTAPPRRLDVRLNGQCNLQCIMCGTWRDPNQLWDSTDFWTRGPKEIFPQLLELDVLGGEPFVQKDTFRLIDEVTKVNSKCTWLFTTNGQWKFGDSIRKRLDRIPIRYIQVSLDSLKPDTFALIRKNGVLEKSLATLEQLAKYRDERAKEGRGFTLAISQAVQVSNWKEVPEFIAFARELKVDLSLQFVYSPPQCGLLFRPHDFQSIVYEFLMKTYSETKAEEMRPILEPLSDSLKQHAAKLAEQSASPVLTTAPIAPVQTGAEASL